MRRRDALKLFIAVLAVPSLSGAQERRAVPRIGIIHPSPPPDPWLDSFQQELRELGYIPGHNIAIDYRSGRGAVLDELARDLLVSRVDILVTTSGPAVLAAKRQTTSVPIVHGHERRSRWNGSGGEYRPSR
jgi:putative ABC transport system substrate-binding protein